MRILAALLLVGCVTAETPSDAVEDLGPLDGKTDGVMTRNLVLRPHRQSGEPSVRTFTLTTAASFRVSLAYEPEAQTRLVVTEDVTDDGDQRASIVTWQPTVLVPAAAAARTVRIRIENTAAIEVPVRFHVATATPDQLRIATFNIRWYGIGGDLDAPKPEHRNPALRAFLAQHLADAEVIVFEEILDVEQLRAEVAPAGWSCVSYANTAPDHQFVVACHAPSLTFTREADDDDFGYQPLAMTSLRPAVHGTLREASTGKPLAHLLGVHLKALPNATAQRLQQAEILAQRLEALEAIGDELPVVVIGDFNAHRAIDSKQAMDDWYLISDVFAGHQLALDWIDYPFANTFRDKTDRGFRLDHMWLGHTTASDVTVAGPCNLPWATGQTAIETHFDTISDHCPLIATLGL
ncbi:MAG TPA: endonuclease/exonuclease/phosphatase family protein [Kofleriaceae bacterium]